MNMTARASSSVSALHSGYDRQKFTLANPEPWARLERIKGERFAEYRRVLARAEKGEVLTDFPVEVLIKTTLNCNHKCPKCLHGMGVFPAGPRFNMKLETLDKVLDEGAQKGLRSVVFTGGEPTMHPQIFEFLSRAKAHGFDDVSMVTNGSKLTDALIDHLIDCGLTRLNISLDAATSATFVATHGVDHHARVVDAIERLLARRERRGSELPLLSLSFVLSEESRGELDAFLERWSGRADGGIKIYPYKDVFSVVDAEFSRTYGAGKRQVSELDPEALPSRLPRSVPLVAQYRIECMSPWYRCHVGINGELQACTTQGFCDHPQMVMGNIHAASFESVWKSERWSALRDAVLRREYDRHPVCAKCQRCV
ncbi:MAG: radical SAM protein [Archangiaceae bacterium]|nr:radical SAM protein [Archangiaceae bacterium]